MARPPAPTPNRSTKETVAASLFHSGLVCTASALVTLCAAVYGPPGSLAIFPMCRTSKSAFTSRISHFVSRSVPPMKHQYRHRGRIPRLGKAGWLRASRFPKMRADGHERLRMQARQGTASKKMVRTVAKPPCRFPRSAPYGIGALRENL